jgi:putative hydrolase of the HAD superfamily
MTAPRALLLDFGGVISVSSFERHRETESLLGLVANSLTWEGPIAPETDPLWQSMQRDEITEREYWAIRASELGEAIGEPGWDMKTLLQRVHQADPEAVIRPEIRSLIEAARDRDILVGILSNELELFYGREFLDRMRVFEQFDAIVDASSTRLLKPDPRAYALAVSALRVSPGEVLFVDDQFRNIAGAVKAGLQTQHFDLRDVPGNIAAIAARLQLTPRLTL